MKLFLSRKFDYLAQMTAETGFVRVLGPTELPYCRRFGGQTCVKDFMAKFNECFTIESVPEILYYLNESGAVFVACDFELQAVQDTSVSFKTSMTMKITVNDEGQLLKIAVIGDTFSAYQALQKARGKALTA